MEQHGRLRAGHRAADRGEVLGEAGGQRRGELADGAGVGHHPVAAGEVEGGGERHRAQHGHDERSGPAVPGDRERVDVLAHVGLGAGEVTAGAVGELPAVRPELGGQLREQGGRAADAVAPGSALGERHRERETGHLGRGVDEVADDDGLRLQHVEARPRPGARDARSSAAHRATPAVARCAEVTVAWPSTRVPS